MQDGESGRMKGFGNPDGQWVWINNRIESGFQKPEIVKLLVENNAQPMLYILVDMQHFILH